MNQFIFSGLLNNKDNQPAILPKLSVRASFFSAVVITLPILTRVRTKAVACHLIFVWREGAGYFIRHTYQPFRMTIFP